jgi:hypothetical protein
MAKPKEILPSTELPKRQPRAIAPTTQAIQPYYRAGLHAELQKFGRSDNKIRELLLGEDIQTEDPGSVEVYGLNNLSKNEDKALSALQILMSETDYQGNIPGETIASTAYKWEGYIPKLSITYSDYFEAYGLTKKDGQYYLGKQAQEALDALKSLTQPKIISYQRSVIDKKGKKKYDIIRVTKPLIGIAEGYKDLEEEEAEKIRAGQDLPEKRHTRLVIEFSPVLVDQIETWYSLKPKTLHSEIQALYPGKHYSKSISDFISWLLTLDKPVFHISRDNLAIKINLGKYLEEKRQTLIDQRLQEALQTALKLNYLLDYKESLLGTLELTLNPEQCKRINRKRRRKKEDK